MWGTAGGGLGKRLDRYRRYVFFFHPPNQVQLGPNKAAHCCFDLSELADWHHHLQDTARERQRKVPIFCLLACPDDLQ